MKNIILILTLFLFQLVFSQNNKLNNSESYDLYITLENESNFIFKKSTEIKDENINFILYYLRIPNQNDPRFLFNFIDKDSTELDFTYKGGNGSDYDFNFLYNSRRHKSFFLDKKKYLKNKLTIQAILSSNVELLYKVFKKANKIYILEEVPDELNKYIAREVDFTRDTKL